ncbi:MAG: SsrA-binding protein SmpB [Verrucomicrobiota bacterium]
MGVERRIATNRKAFRDYHVIQKYEAGIELFGTEVKSLKNGQINLTGSFAKVEPGEEAYLYNLTIPPYEHGNRFNHKQDRPRKLLLHKTEIMRLVGATREKGLSLIPLSLYTRRGYVKLELGLCRGKKLHDKRQDMKEKTQKREIKRAVSRKR